MTSAAARTLPLHQRISWARRRKGISQETLAALVGTTRRHMIRIEKGETKSPAPGLLRRIAEATDQDTDFFTDDEDDEESDPVAALVAAVERFARMVRPEGAT